MSDFRKDLQIGETKEFELCDFLNYINYDGCKFYQIKNLHKYDISNDVRQKIEAYQAQVKARVKPNPKSKQDQIDAIKVYSSGEIEEVEIKWDNSKYLTYNLFVEFKDVALDKDGEPNGEVKVTGPWRSVIKKEKLWVHMRDRNYRHNEDVIVYFFDPQKLSSYVDAHKTTYQKKQKKNFKWMTYGWLVPEEEIKDICEFEMKISNEDYERFFSTGELSATSQ